MVPGNDSTLIDRIDDLLPQTQCGKCGYNGCRPYAQAIAAGEAEINQCPPGGAPGISDLANLLGRAPLALNPKNGTETPKTIARIDESVCIGCVKCVQACPVDAIVGSAKLMHTVITEDCTGCELCIPPCPVDCIAMVPMPPPLAQRNRAAQWRQRYLARQARLAHQESLRSLQIQTRKMEVKKPEISKAAVNEAIARSKAKKGDRGIPPR